VRQGLSDLGGARPETLSVATRSRESTIYGEKGPEAVAQAAQVEGLPDLDHARYFSEVSAAVPVETIEEAVISRIYYLVRALL
jgi:hypothetical protein